MKRIMNSFYEWKYFFLTASIAFVSSVLPASAQNAGQQVIESTKSALNELLDSVASLLQVVLGLGALVCLSMVVFKLFKGDREAAEKLAWWVAGLTLGFTLITVVKNLTQTAVV